MNYTFRGQTKSLYAWSRDAEMFSLGLNYPTLQHRIKSGWSIERTLTTPPGKQNGRKPKADGPALTSLPDLPTIDLASIDELIDTYSVEARAKRIETLRQKHAYTLKLIESWQARHSVANKQRGDLIERRNKIVAMESSIPFDKFIAAKTAAERGIETLTNTVDMLERGTKEHEAHAAKIGVELAETFKASQAPNPAAVAPAPVAAAPALPAVEPSVRNRDEWHRIIDIGQGVEWDRVRSLRAEISNRKMEIARYGALGEMGVARYIIAILAGRQRQLRAELQDPEANEAAYIVGNGFAWAVKEFRDTLGHIQALDLSFACDWDEYCQEQQRLLDAALANVAAQPIAKPLPEWQPAATLDVVPELPDMTDPEADAIADELAPIARDLRLAVFGGSPTRNAALHNWMEQRLKFARIKWHEQPDSCAQSIGMNGVEVLLLLLRDVQHKHTMGVTNAAKSKGIPIAVSTGTSRAEVARELLRVMK